MSLKSVIIIGGFHEVIEQVTNLNLDIIGIIDNSKKGDYYNCKILGDDINAKAILNNYKDSSLIITPDNCRIRKNLYNYYVQFDNPFFTLVSKFAMVSKFSKIGEGVMICQNAHISAETSIGDFCKINVGANIMHNCAIGNFCTIAPNSVILGNVQIGNETYIGANTTILPNITIGNNVMIGAGSVVTKDISDGKKVMGVPAK